MTYPVLLPKIGFSMNEAELKEWLVEDGASVAIGDPLYSLESDKSVIEIEAPAAGRLRIIGAAGTTYSVGDKIAEIL